MINLELKLLTVKRYKFITTFIIFGILTMTVIILITQFFDKVLPERSVEEKTLWYFLAAILLAPIVETYIFQKLPIEFFRDSSKKDWPLVLVSGIPFGVVHYFQQYFIRDIFYAFFIGSIFAYAYILAKKRDDLNAFWAVVLIHAGYNFFGVIIHLIVD